MSRRLRIVLVVSAAVLIGTRRELCEAQAERTFDVRERSIQQIHDTMRRGELTCVQLVDTYLRRIAAYDQASSLNAILVVNPHARRRAAELDDEYRSSGKLRPLHGIAAIVKDNFDTKDLPTTAGSRSLQGSMPPDDSFLVKRLRQAGAIVVAKSNMAEFAFSPYETVSSMGGITRNPYDLERVPAGSSGGTASAVAVSFGTIGLGTDTGNSIRGPSSHTALVGLRPTLGLTSRDGIVPLYARNDVGGPMCRTVEDVARVLDVIAGHDAADPITVKSEGRMPSSYLASLAGDGLAGARLGVLKTLAESPSVDRDISALFASAVLDLQLAGAEIVDNVVIPELRGIQRLLWRNTFSTRPESLPPRTGTIGPREITRRGAGQRQVSFVRGRQTGRGEACTDPR